MKKSSRPLDGDLVLRPFSRFLTTQDLEIACPQMRLEPFFDHQPPVFEGSGRILLQGTQGFKFEMQTRPADLAVAIDAIRANAERPDLRENWLRLKCTDYSGIEWNAGWVGPRVRESNALGWQLSGECSGLMTIVQQEPALSGVELAYSPAPDVPFSEHFAMTTRLGDAELSRSASGGRHRMSVLGCDIEIGTLSWADGLWVAASSSDALTHPYLENWLSEPLRALRGKLIYPRLVARKFDDGRTFVSICRSPSLKQSFGGCAAALRNRSSAEFWKFYERYLTYVAQHRDKSGTPNFEANVLTRLHDEVIQARQAGSPWVIALTVASAIEGVLKTFPDFASVSPSFTEDDLAPIAILIPTLEDEALREYVQGFVDYEPKPSAGGYLRRLETSKLVSKESAKAWRDVRHKVMHGNLFEPWGSEGEDERLRQLLKLFYGVTAIAIGYTTGAAGVPAS